MSDVCSRQMPDFSAKMHQIQFPPSPTIPWLQYSVAALSHFKWQWSVPLLQSMVVFQ